MTVLGGLLVLALGAWAQPALTIEQATARRELTLAPAHEGETVSVQGTVTSKAVLFGDYAHLPLRDNRGHAIMLEAPDFMFERVTAGDLLEVRGVIAQRGGMPVLQPMQLTTLHHTAPPEPLSRTIQQLQSLQAVGLTVVTSGRVVAVGEDAGGTYLMLDDGQPVLYPVYLPKTASRVGARLNRYHIGDRVHVTGTAGQAATEPPFQSKFRLVVTDASSVQLIERDSLVPPQALLAVFLSFITVVLIGFARHQRNRQRRRYVRRINGFCEELLACTSAGDILRKLETVAPRALEVSSVELYRYDRASQTLRRTFAPQHDPIAIGSVRNSDKGNERHGQALSLCFRNRTPLHIADIRRSSLFKDAVRSQGVPRESTPRSVVLLPMFARGELSGVLEVSVSDRPRRFHPEELTALQHLANQVAMLLKLVDQYTRKEQVLRSERLAASGQIITGVAGELKGPLEAILMLAHRILEHGNTSARAILSESLRATAILSRYSQVTRSEDAGVAPVEINTIVNRAAAACRKEIPGNELAIELALWRDPLWVEGSADQVECVLRNLLLLAARAAKPSLERALFIESSLSARRIVISIRYGAIVFDESLSGSPLSPEDGALSFGVCRAIVHSFGGEVRVLRAAENACRMEVDLPAAFFEQPAEPVSAAPLKQSTRSLTALIIEPDLASQRRLVSHWAGHGHRAVPIHSEAEALELLRRLRIDVIFCAIRTSSGNWVEFFDQVSRRVPAFVLLAEGLDSNASPLFPEGEGFVLRKPLEAGEMDRVLERIEAHAEATAPVTA